MTSIFMLFMGCLLAAGNAVAGTNDSSAVSSASSPSAVSITSAASSAPSSVTATSMNDPATLARHIYLGQLYPSGRIYLVPFPLGSDSQSENDYQKSFPWPQSVSWHAIHDASPITDKTKAARLSRVLRDSQQGNVISSVYIPALEGMDDEHEPCGGGPKVAKNRRYIYLGDDFFRQVLDNCDESEGTAVYKGDKPGIFSYSVVAFDEHAPLTDIELVKNKTRPLTPEEAAQVAKEKEDFKQATKDDESYCTTNPSYLDEAELLMTAKVKGTDLTIRLSRYETPGCGGHLAAYYILDFLKNGKLVQKYQLEQYIGLI